MFDLISTAGFVPGLLGGVLLTLATGLAAVLIANIVGAKLDDREARTLAAADATWSAQRDRRHGGRRLTARQAHAARVTYGALDTDAANDTHVRSPRAQMRSAPR